MMTQDEISKLERGDKVRFHIYTNDPRFTAVGTVTGKSAPVFGQDYHTVVLRWRNEANQKRMCYCPDPSRLIEKVEG